MPLVYHFKVYDPHTDETIVPPRKSTAERIKEIGGLLLAETEETVSPDKLDDHGRHMPEETIAPDLAEGATIVEHRR